MPKSYTDTSGKTVKVTKTMRCNLSDMHQVKKVILPDGFYLSGDDNFAWYDFFRRDNV